MILIPDNAEKFAINYSITWARKEERIPHRIVAHIRYVADDGVETQCYGQSFAPGYFDSIMEATHHVVQKVSKVQASETERVTQGETS